MGAWDELDIEISVHLDTTELDDVINFIESEHPDGALDGHKEVAIQLKHGWEEGSKRAVEDIANRNRSFQDQVIWDVCDNPSGMLASSIDVEAIDEYTYLVGTRINHIYPMALEFGRGPIEPINAKALAFYSDTGELIFRKRVGEAKPRPFVAPAYEDSLGNAKRIMMEYIGDAIKNG